MSFSRSAPCLLERGTLFSRYVTLANRRVPTRWDPRSAGRCNCIPFARISSRRARFAPAFQPPASIRLGSPARTSKRGRLIIGLSFSLTLSPGFPPRSSSLSKSLLLYDGIPWPGDNDDAGCNWMPVKHGNYLKYRAKCEFANSRLG